jgi:DNA repair protein RadC
VAHNHPTGDPTPSEEDVAVTAQLKSAAEIVSIPMRYHLVLGWNGYNVLYGK